MKKVSYEEYVAAKTQVMSGGECNECSNTDEYGRIHKTICCEDGNNFYEVTENGETEFWSTKHAESRKYIEAKKEVCKDAGTYMDEKDYQELAGLSDTAHMSDAEAQIFISKELGFSAEKVKIVRMVKTYYVEDRRIKVLNEYAREPVYNSSDWNYFRFDVCGWQYELVNGDLRFYES